MANLLHDVMARARDSAFYRRSLPSSSLWKDVPVTTKASLRSGYPFDFLAVDRKKIATYHESSGTEGKPISSYFTENDWQDIAERFLRNGVNLSPDDLFFIKTPYAMVTTAHQAHAAARLRGVPVVPADNRSSLMPYSRVLQCLRDLKITVTWSLPTEVIVWRVAAELNGFSIGDFPELRAFWVAGEPLSPGKRDALRGLWGGKMVFQDYGSTETGSLAGECDLGSLHLWSDRVYFEVLDPQSGVISPTGRGQLLVTPLFREAMPLLRYLIEDEVEIQSSHCACGSRHATIRVLGRASARLNIAGKAFYPLEIEEAVYRAGNHCALALWRGFPENNRLRVEYHCLGETGPGSAAAIQQGIETRLGVPVAAAPAALDSFLSRTLATQPLSFTKPRFLFRPGENSLRGIQYA